MRPLFAFNDAFVAAAAYGDDDDDLYALFEQAFDEVEDEIMDELRTRTGGQDFKTGWDDEGFYVDLDEAQTQDEFGGPEHTLRPVVRPALVAASYRAKMRAEKVLDV